MLAAQLEAAFGPRAAGTVRCMSVAPLLMATAVLYALPPAALYYAVRRYMVTGLTAGGVKS